MEDIARALGLELPSRRRPKVTETLLPAEGRVHSAACECADPCAYGECVAADIKGVSALPPGVARCDDAYDQAVSLLRGDGDAAVAAARRGAR